MSKIISKEEVIAALLAGFEVLYISVENLKTADTYLLRTEILSRRVFASIENITKNATEGDLFIKTERV